MRALRFRTLVVLCFIWVLHSAQAYAQTAAPTNVKYLDNGRIRLGIDLNLGGAITYISLSGSSVNLINSFDWGRQIQMSNYSGPVPFVPNGKPPRPDWAGLGWNPIQSGDCYGNRSKVTLFKNYGKEIVVRCVPMQWPLNNEPGECEFECRLSLDGYTVKVSNALLNRRSDKTQWAGRDQELPAVYTNGPWYKVVTYTGDAPFTYGTLTYPPVQFPWTGWNATENWAALIDDKGFGLGIYEPGLIHFIGGFAGKPGSGGPKDGPTGYIAPLHVEILDYNITYRYNYTLIVGTLENIRSWVYAHHESPALPDYRFLMDRQHWHYANAVDEGWPIHGELKVSLAQNNPQLIGPQSIWNAETAPVIHLSASFPPDIKRLRIFWTRSDSPQFNETCVLTFPVTGDGEYHEYAFKLSSSEQYRGVVTGLRIDPETVGLPGKHAGFKRIWLNEKD